MGNWTYTYDEFNRLLTAATSFYPRTGAADGCSWAYDRYGNRWQQNATSGNCPSPQLAFDNNNHWVGYAYDAAGNLTNNGYNSFTYDAEGRVVNVDNGNTAAYIYDAFGRRVSRYVAGSITLDAVHDLSNRLISEFTTSWSFNNGEAYAGNRHSVSWCCGVTYFPTSDQVGTTRTYYDNNGSWVGNDFSLPFGDGGSSWGPEVSPMHFTGQHTDYETLGIVHFMARSLSVVQGRWISPDPAGLAAVDPSNPQSWNRYAYVTNNPTGYVDPLGLSCHLFIDVVYGEGGYPSGWSWNRVCDNDDGIQRKGPGGGPGGGTGGKPPAPTTPQSQPPQQLLKTIKDCRDAFLKTKVGRATEFGSVVSLVPGLNSNWPKNWFDWGALGTAKYTVGTQYAEGLLSGTEFWSLSGTVTRKGAPLAEKLVGKFITRVAPVGVAVATIADLAVLEGCSLMNSPELTDVLQTID